MANPSIGPVITITGLAKFRKQVKSLGGDFAKVLNREMKAIARPVEADARKRYGVLHPGSGRSVRGIRATTRRGGSAIALGGPKYPYLQGQEWGTHGRFPQFPTPWGRSGRYFWPAIVAGASEAASKVFSELDLLSRRVFPGR